MGLFDLFGKNKTLSYDEVRELILNKDIQRLKKISIQSFSTRHRSGDTPAYFAAEKGYKECLQIIAERAPETLRTQNRDGATPAFIAAEKG
ncbi:MAG: hypothetical protein CO106_05250, partial [Deltaproteobacteria bacterium CG_4_9_14_3_um_filter_44_9]